jgi:hypothetical protein
MSIEGGICGLCLRLIKALYGCVKSVLLWYDLFVERLNKICFELNPHDMCVANKIFNGKQCTIAWYVDDMKISHVDASVVTSIISSIEHYFGKMRITRGPKHTFLGLNIVLKQDGTFDVNIKEYIF